MRRYTNNLYVLGHDTLWHATRSNGTSLCAMGRASPPLYGDHTNDKFAQCVVCLTRLYARGLFA